MNEGMNEGMNGEGEGSKKWVVKKLGVGVLK